MCLCILLKLCFFISWGIFRLWIFLLKSKILVNLVFHQGWFVWDRYFWLLVLCRTLIFLKLRSILSNNSVALIIWRIVVGISNDHIGHGCIVCDSSLLHNNTDSSSWVCGLGIFVDYKFVVRNWIRCCCTDHCLTFTLLTGKVFMDEVYRDLSIFYESQLSICYSVTLKRSIWARVDFLELNFLVIWRLTQWILFVAWGHWLDTEFVQEVFLGLRLWVFMFVCPFFKTIPL